MRAILGLIAVCAIAVGAAWWLQHLTGDISVHVGTWTVQAPLSVALLALILLVLATYLLLRLLATLFGLPGAFRQRGHRSRRSRGDQAVTGTLVALAAREPEDARRQAARARRLLGDTPQTLLLAAYAGGIGGDESEAEEAFTKLSERKDSAFLGLRGLLRLAIAKEDYARAAELARAAEAAHPGTTWLRTERTQLAIRTGAWSEALQLTQENTERAAFGAAAAEASDDPQTAHKLAKQAWKRNPALTAAALAYARRLRDGGREKAALDVLRKSWALAPNPELATFAMLPAADKLARHQIGTDLVRDALSHAESQMLLARLALDVGLISEARTHAEAAASAGITQRRLYILLADIAQAEGSDGAQRDALRLAAAAETDSAWRCGACGTPQGAWHAACPVCHTVGRINWGIPAPSAVLLPPKD